MNCRRISPFWHCACISGSHPSRAIACSISVPAVQCSRTAQAFRRRNGAFSSFGGSPGSIRTAPGRLRFRPRMGRVPRGTPPRRRSVVGSTRRVCPGGCLRGSLCLPGHPLGTGVCQGQHARRVPTAAPAFGSPGPGSLLLSPGRPAERPASPIGPWQRGGVLPGGVDAFFSDVAPG